jgi:hypothetical protein
VSAASIHLIGAVAQWFQTYKQSVEFQNSDQFEAVVISKFAVDTHHSKTMELLSLKQTGSVEDYRCDFEQLVYHIRLYDGALSATMLTAHFIMCLKDELRFPIEMQLPESVTKVVVVAAIQEKLLEKNQKRGMKQGGFKTSFQSKADTKTPFASCDMWKAR